MIIIIIVITYLLNIAPFNIKMIKSFLHDFKDIYKNKLTKRIINNYWMRFL